MKTFQRKPEIITAVQWIDTNSYWDICTFLGVDLTYIGAKKLLEIPVGAFGYVYAEPTDWVVIYADGSVAVLKNDNVLANYNEITLPNVNTTTDSTTTAPTTDTTGGTTNA
jgi:hypothetical protein